MDGLHRQFKGLWKRIDQDFVVHVAWEIERRGELCLSLLQDARFNEVPNRVG